MAKPLTPCLMLMVFFMASSSVQGVRHIVFIVADDLGWNDVGFHNPDMITPNIDRLAGEGVILNNSYVQPLCSPSRHAIMSGTYPFKYGMQRFVLFPNIGKCAPLELEYLPQRLKKLGYNTHIVGKWHLGFCNVNCTPTYRGFDSFLGVYNGKEDYYTKYLGPGIDFNENLIPTRNDEYSSIVYARRAREIITEHNTTKPLFLYLPFQSVHSPLQVPKRFEDMYPNVQDAQRKTYSGMVSALDEAIGEVIEQLKQSGLYNDTLIVFTTDNGGLPMEGGNNYPLRGAKGTIFEGGTRATAFVHGAGLQKTGYTYGGLMHVVDWHNTVVAAAGGPEVTGVDGLNLWESIRKGINSTRTEFVYNLDNKQEGTNGHATIRVGDYKLIDGYPGKYTDWYKPPQIHDNGIANEDHNSPENDHQDQTLYYQPRKGASTGTRQYEGASSGTTQYEETSTATPQYEGDGLYNIRDDPEERVDLSDTHPDIVKELKAKLAEYRKSMVPPPELPFNPAADPAKHGGFWVPGWC